MMKLILFFVLFFILSAESTDNSKEIDILWNKYGEVRADVETLKAQVEDQQDIKVQLNDLREELTDLNIDVQMLKTSNSEDVETQTQGRPEIDPSTALQLQIHRASISSNHGNPVTFTVDYATPVNILVDWEVDYEPLYDGNADFIVNTSPHLNYYRSTMAANVLPDDIIGKRISVSFVKLQSSHPIELVRFTIVFNTTDFSTKTDSGIMGMSFRAETVPSENSLQKSVTYIPHFADLDYEVKTFYTSYTYLNETGGKTYLSHAVSFRHFYNTEVYVDDVGGISSQNVTEKKEEFKALVTLNNSLEQYGGDLYANIEYNVEGNAVSNIGGVIKIDYVFAEGVPVAKLRGKFTVHEPRSAEMDFGGTGYIHCLGWGYPAPALQIAKINADNTTAMFSYREVRNYRSNHYSRLVISIPNVTKQTEGNYTCIGMLAGVTKKRLLQVKIAVPAKFDKGATVITKYPDGKVEVDISASGDPIPDIDCMENDRRGYNLKYERNHYNLTRFENPTENRVQLNIQISSAYNVTRYEPLNRIVCSASRNYGRKVDDWLTVEL